MLEFAISINDVQVAAKRLTGVAHRTPILQSRRVNERVGAEVYFKCENFQRAGAFKFRGAYNALAQFSSAEAERGVVAFSSGNHAQGVAYAAQILNIPATIVMPTDAPAAKMAATRAYGANIHPYNRQSEDREAVARQVAAEKNAVLIPPYDHPHIMAGQGTATLEFLEEVPDLDFLLVPVGGGGLLSGAVTVAQAISPTLQVYGVETEASNDWWLSMQKQERVWIEPPQTIADGMRTQQPGQFTFPIVQAGAAGILLVSDEAVREAMRFLLSRMKILVEPTGAVPAAAAFSQQLSLAGKKVGIVISGGNVDLDKI